MTKEKIISISNTEDAIWYGLAPTDATLEKLDNIFDIYEKLYFGDEDKVHSYIDQIRGGESSFHQESKEYVVYFIFIKKVAHVILRRTLKWKKFSKLIEENFDFVIKSK